MDFRPALAFCVVVVTGCGTPAEPVPVKAPPMESSTTHKPEEQKLDQKTSLAELEQNQKLRAYPGATEIGNAVIKRGDGGLKYEVEFSTKDSVQKVSEFYRGEGLDTKMEGGNATSMGMTKANASVLVFCKPGENGTQVKISALAYPKR